MYGHIALDYKHQPAFNQSQHSRSTVAAQSQHSHSTVTAQSQHSHSGKPTSHSAQHAGTAHLFAKYGPEDVHRREVALLAELDHRGAACIPPRQIGSLAEQAAMGANWGG